MYYLLKFIYIGDVYVMIVDKVEKINTQTFTGYQCKGYTVEFLKSGSHKDQLINSTSFNKEEVIFKNKSLKKVKEFAMMEIL